MTGTEATLKAFLTSNALPSHEELLKLTDGVLSVLENESTSYRPHDKEGKPGGLLDFTAKEYSSLPVAVLPDLHGRGNFLLKFLTHKINDKPVLELLEHEQIIVCCVGDIFHSEQRGKERWINAWKGFQSGDYTNSFMQEEMKENLSLLQMIFLLKTKACLSINSKK